MVSPSSGKKQKKQNKNPEKYYINGFQPAPKDIKGV